MCVTGYVTDLVSPPPRQHLVLPLVFILVVVTGGGGGHLPAAFTCIPPTTNDGEHLFMSLFAIHLSSSVKHLFELFVYFLIRLFGCFYGVLRVLYLV